MITLFLCIEIIAQTGPVFKFSLKNANKTWLISKVPVVVISKVLVVFIAVYFNSDYSNNC